MYVVKDIIQLPLSIAMIVIGAQKNTSESCSIEGISTVLKVMGGLLLFIAILNIMQGLSVYAAEKWATMCQIASCPIIVVAGLAQLGVQIWASVVVFGAYSTWEYDEKSFENFCEYGLFMFAFVTVIIHGLFLVLSCAIGCCLAQKIE